MKDRVSIDLLDGVADVRLIRADKMNALDPAMFEGIIAAGDKLLGMKGVRCVVLSGEGKAFCAGLDMGSFAAMKDRATDKDPGGVPGARDLTKRTHGIANVKLKYLDAKLQKQFHYDAQAAAEPLVRATEYFRRYQSSFRRASRLHRA